jgi:hypothetical protein
MQEGSMQEGSMQEGPVVEIRTSPEDAAKFVDDLMNDADFRAELERGGDSAVAALARYDIRISPELVAEYVELPSSEELEEALTAMDAGEFAPETAHVKFMKFWPIFWAMIKFRKFRSAAD